LNIGQNKSYINSIEIKKTLPSVSGLFYICDYLKIKPKDFFDVDNENLQLLDDIMTGLKELNTTSLEQVAILIKKFAGK